METHDRTPAPLRTLGDTRREKVTSLVVMGVSSAVWVGLLVAAVAQG